MSNRRGRARYSLVVITLCGVSALGRSLGWSTRMTQPVMSVPSGWSARARIKSDSRSLVSGLAGLREQALLEAQRIAAVRVVAAVAAELPVAALLVAGDGGVVFR